MAERRIRERCYMCESESNSDEHVPPRGIFPDVNALMSLGIQGVDLRVNLLTVPSCAVHNMATSRDDEYFMYILAMNHATNGTGEIQLLTRIRSAYERRPALMQSILSNSQPAIISDGTEVFNTRAVQVDTGRLTRELDKIARAIYFSNTGNRWFGNTFPIIEFMEFIEPQQEEARRSYARYRGLAQLGTSGLQRHGSNPDVFWYSVVERGEGEDRIVLLRLCFYGGAYVSIVLFNSLPQQRTGND